VLLHEGLGSVSSWRDFPQELAGATGRPVLAYDRPGYGRSGPRPGPWPADFLHRGAVELAGLLGEEALDRAVLVGHSDGASLALLYPSQAPPGSTAVLGTVSLSAHVFIEPVNVESIHELQRRYAADVDELRTRLTRHHDRADELFDAWSEVWVSDRFRPFDIEAELAAVSCPVLAVQGGADSYGTRLQLDRVAAAVSGPVEVHELPGVDHWPHREATGDVLALIDGFCRRLPL
jgi:pimeloyl-ACP methyl ester carboxylesterase